MQQRTATVDLQKIHSDMTTNYATFDKIAEIALIVRRQNVRQNETGRMRDMSYSMDIRYVATKRPPAPVYMPRPYTSAIHFRRYRL